MMISTTIFEFGDVVLVPFPYTNQTSSKKRPAIVVSRPSFHARHPDIIVMAVTSQVRVPMFDGGMMLNAWQSAGLLRPSAAKPVLLTIEKSLVLRQLGQLGPVDRLGVSTLLQAILGD